MANKTLRTHLKNMPYPDRAAVADKANISPEYLRQIAYGHRHASPDLALELEALVPADVASGAESLVSSRNKKLIARLKAHA